MKNWKIKCKEIIKHVKFWSNILCNWLDLKKYCLFAICNYSFAKNSILKKRQLKKNKKQHLEKIIWIKSFMQLTWLMKNKIYFFAINLN